MQNLPSPSGLRLQSGQYLLSNDDNIVADKKSHTRQHSQNSPSFGRFDPISLDFFTQPEQVIYIYIYSLLFDTLEPVAGWVARHDDYDMSKSHGLDAGRTYVLTGTYVLACIYSTALQHQYKLTWPYMD